MKRVAIYAVCAALALTLPGGAWAQQKERPARDKAATAEEKFYRKAAEDNIAEVQLGRLAAEKAASDEVKKFGQRMAGDHQKAYDELQKLAQTKGVTLPSEPDARTKKEYDRLSKLSGADFDRAYMRTMVRDHDRDVKAFQRESKRGRDAEARDWAAKTLPTLEDHQKQAHDIAPHVGAGGRRAGGSPSASPGSPPPSNR